MATGKLIGRDVSYSTSSAAGYILMSRFAADSDGILTTIHVYSQAAGNIKVCVYADSSGAPGSRLTVNNAGVVCSAGQWNAITVPDLSITSGTYYWLAIICDASGVDSQNNSLTDATSKYKASSYASGLPDPAGSGYSDTPTPLSLSGYGVLVLSPSSISQPISYGSPKLNLSIKPSSILQALAYGTPAVSISGIIISPQGIAVIISYGTPTLKYPQTISPSSIISLVSYGIPSVGIFGFIRPQGTIQPVTIGTPIILKYIWHVILDGQYATETPGVNRAYIIGRDQYGNPVYGTAVNTDEIALIGERLDFQPDSAIPTAAQAGEVASAVLSKMRLSGKRGVILIPPNCGQELFDAVQIWDSGANQSAVKFRVAGIHFEYNTKESRYQHRLILVAM